MAKALTELDTKIAEVAACCTCANLRRAARALTRSYDAVLQPSGLKVTQFSLLIATAFTGPQPMSSLAKALVMDRTTLTRNLKPLEAQGLVQVSVGEDRRLRQIGITPKGRARLKAALPLWQQAQERVIEDLGETRWRGLLGNLSDVVALTHAE